MDHQRVRRWLRDLDEEDLQFIRRFVLASGSLKALAAEYGISYPTLRGRLDRLIAKVQAADTEKDEDAFQRTIRLLVAGGELSPATARRLLDAYRDTNNTKETPS